MTLSPGMQRLRNIKTKVRIRAQRELREFLAGERPYLECTSDQLDEEIAREFDRLASRDDFNTTAMKVSA